MFIKALVLENFKSYENTKIEFDEKFNVIIGENNIGKSTIFEALQLWNKCYNISIASKGDKFYSKTTSLYLNFDDLHFMRLASDEDIFSSNKSSKKCLITVVFGENTHNNSENYELTFSLAKPNINNAYVRVLREKVTEFDRLVSSLEYQNIKLRELMFIHQTTPVSNVLNKESYMYKGQIIKKIAKGQSDEVLRNKILQSIASDSSLLERMKEVLDIDFCFILPKNSQKDKDEYIKLLVSKDGKDLDIYLQGSGFLQVAEIFSTIKIMNNAINILLIDEPDSHISPRIQSRLLNCLQGIENTQTFIISHNDNFISDMDPSKILFINDTNKQEGLIQGLSIDQMDSMHFTLGGIITGLTSLQKHKKVFFVEGIGDFLYIKALNTALKRINSGHAINLEKVLFWNVRGKDNFSIKIETGRRLVCQILQGCNFGAIFDKDFATWAATEKFIQQKINKNSNKYKWLHIHCGYCIESVLFSDLDILKKYLEKLMRHAKENLLDGEEFTSIDLENFIQTYTDSMKSAICNLRSELYQEMEDCFRAQKSHQRSELDKVEFNDFVKEIGENIELFMNKKNISNFVAKLENETGRKLFSRDRETPESISTEFLNNYFATLDNEEEIYPDFLTLMNKLASA